MAATSPYSPNDQSVNNYRGYHLPVNDIFKALTAQDQFWKIGAEKIARVYDNAMNLKLSLAPNREIREKFMQDADKELTRISSMNVALPGVQREGFNIFKPLLQDDGIVSDDAATRHIEGIQTDIAKFREQDNGKYYADNNALFALDGAYDFKKSTDRMAGKAYLQKARDYIPYYDPTKEFMDIAKNCKGSSVSSTIPGASTDMYLHTQEVSGASDVRMRGCLQSGLSQKAKDQMNIDGYAAYMSPNRIDHPEGKNYQALRDDYVVYNKRTMDGIDQEIKDLDGKMVAFQAQYDKTKDKRYLDLKQAAQDAKDSYLDQGKNLTETFNQIAAGNLDFIRKNYQPIAEAIYTSKNIATFAEAFRNDKALDKYSADAVKLQQQRLIYDEGKTQADYQHDIEMEKLKFENSMKLEALKGTTRGKKLDKNGNVVEDLIPTNPTLASQDKVTNGYADFIKEKADVSAQLDATNSELFHSLKRKYPDAVNWNKYNEQSFFAPGPNGISPAMSFLDTHGKLADEDSDVASWSSRSALLTNKFNLLKTQEDINEAEIDLKNPNLKNLADVKERFDMGGYHLSATDIQNALQNTHPLIGVRTVTKSYGGVGAPATPVDLQVFYDKRTGQTIASQETGQNWEPIRKILNKIDAKTTSLSSARNDLYGQTMLVSRPDVYATANNIDKEDPTRNNILAALPGQFQLDDIKIISKDPTTGTATVSIKGNSKINVGSNEAKRRLNQLAGTDEAPKFDEGSNEVVLKVQSPYLIDKRTTDNPLETLQLNLQKIELAAGNAQTRFGKVRPGETIITLPIVTKSTGGKDFQVEVIKQANGVKYEVWMKNTSTLTDSQGNVVREKGKYARTGISFLQANQLLEYINAAQ